MKTRIILIRAVLTMAVLIGMTMEVNAQLYINSPSTPTPLTEMSYVTQTVTSTSSLLSIGGPIRIVGGIIAVLDLATVTTGGAGTFDFYLTTSDGVTEWDLVHFPQIAADGAKTYVARVSSGVVPQTVDSSGVSTNNAVLRTDTAGSNNGVRTLAAGSVRHGEIGNRFRLYMVNAGGTTVSYKVHVYVE